MLWCYRSFFETTTKSFFASLLYKELASYVGDILTTCSSHKKIQHRRSEAWRHMRNNKNIAHIANQHKYSELTDGKRDIFVFKSSFQKS